MESQINMKINSVLELLSIDVEKKQKQKPKPANLYLTQDTRRKSKCIKDLKV